MMIRPLAMRRLAAAASAGRERVLELLFPPSCTACHVPLESAGPASFCLMCLEQLAVFQPPFCHGCGASVPVDLRGSITCGHCGGERPRFDRAVALGPYDGLLRDLLLRAKKRPGESLAVALARRLLVERGSMLSERNFDVVCAVPMHWRRRLRRLCNSPATMADVIARELGVPLAANLLRRNRSTVPQYTLPPSSRQENVRRAFSISPGYHLQAAHVLLIDDILTTGSTCNEAARVLKRAGAAQVSVAVIGRSYSGR